MKYFLLCLTLFLISCSTYDREIPVRDINTHKIGKISYYLVQKGDTLYSIAWQNDRDYRELAELNNLKPPYTLHPNDRVQLSGFKKIVKKEPVTKTSSPQKQSYRFIWPVKGKVTQEFSNINKGIEISGHSNTKILASSSGKIVYADNGVRGYGYLVIIKHGSDYLTAYGYNRALLVREGEYVKTGQPIAIIGTSPSEKYALHFEIRKNGKPLNPKRYLR